MFIGFFAALAAQTCTSSMEVTIKGFVHSTTLTFKSSEAVDCFEPFDSLFKDPSALSKSFLQVYALVKSIAYNNQRSIKQKYSLSMLGAAETQAACDAICYQHCAPTTASYSYSMQSAGYGRDLQDIKLDVKFACPVGMVRNLATRRAIWPWILLGLLGLQIVAVGGFIVPIAMHVRRQRSLGPASSKRTQKVL